MLYLPELNKMESVTISVEPLDSVCIVENGLKKNIPPGGLIRKTYGYEKAEAKLPSYILTNTVVGVWLRTTKDIPADVIQKAIVLAAQNHDSLQMCIKKRRFQYWLRRVKELKVHIETSTQNDTEAFNELMSTEYDMQRGPLWKVRIVHCCPDSDCRGEEKFTFVIMLAAAHVITDGKTSLGICRNIVRYINNMMSGQTSIVDTVCAAPGINPPMTAAQISYNLKCVWEQLLHEMPSFKKSISFNGALKLAAKPTPLRTGHLFDTIGKEDTSELIKKCKLHKVSVNSCMTTLINYALLTTAQSQAKHSLGNHPVVASHAVDLRRYFEQDHQDSLGCHISFVVSQTNHELSQPFWTSAVDVNSKLKEHLQDDVALKQISTLTNLSIFPTVNYWKSRWGMRKTLGAHYLSSNMGDVSKTFASSDASDVAKVVYVTRGSCDNYYPHLFQVSYQSFNGRLLLSVYYHSKSISKETVKSFLQTLCNLISKVANDNPSK